MSTMTALQTSTENQPTEILLGALTHLEPRWSTTGLERHESLTRFAIASTITKRHGIEDRVNDLYLDEAEGFDGSELEAIILALAEVNA